MRLAIAAISVGSRLRQLREPIVRELMDSISMLGLREPISVSTGLGQREGGGPEVVTFALVVGRHRLEACRRLGRTEIEANILQLDEAECKLWEIDENLCRAELSQLERAEHLLKRKEIFEKRYPSAKAGVMRALGMNRALGRNVDDNNVANVAFTADTEKKTGLGQRKIQRALRRADGISTAVRDRIRDRAGIANSGVELDTLAALRPSDQEMVVGLVEKGEAFSVREATRLLALPAKNVTKAEAREEQEFERLMLAWKRAGTAARRRFLTETANWRELSNGATEPGTE
jgi:ParB family transcriptional regulator, chromosome partitioning protein